MSDTPGRPDARQIASYACIAEIVLRSHFASETAYARFKVDRGVRVSRGERLDPDGSFVIVDRPVPEVPSAVEHMPGGVVDGHDGRRCWTLMTRWTLADGRLRITRRYDDGSSASEMRPADMEGSGA